MKTIVFQGDSVTDVGRNREIEDFMGMGYPTMVKGRLGLEHPGEYRFYNRGISGNRIVDVYARMKKDILNLEPDVLSLLIGVNDVWHEVKYRNGVDTEKYEKIYRMMLEDIRAARPHIRFILLEPFVMPGTNSFAEEDSDEGRYFRREVSDKAAVVRRVAADMGATFVPLQQALTEAAARGAEAEVLMDGIHPTAIGHELIARRWMEAFEGL